MKLWIGILTAVFIIGGTVYGVSAMEHEEKLYQEPIEKNYENVAVSPETAEQIALKNVNGVVKEIDLEHKDGNSVYEIEVETNTDEEEIYIDARNGNVITNKEIESIKISQEDDDNEGLDD
ncbi:PepSY domain-containing protein [Bacillus sp. ISL-8]|nr:PepSY domain-containing protein [Bacillus mycoides]MBT2580767.1 PepSY domain-containing protein [Bacillus sp. ISL-8]